jgi:hypothetical protein
VLRSLGRSAGASGRVRSARSRSSPYTIPKTSVASERRIVAGPVDDASRMMNLRLRASSAISTTVFTCTMRAPAHTSLDILLPTDNANLFATYRVRQGRARTAFG